MPCSPWSESDSLRRTGRSVSWLQISPGLNPFQVTLVPGINQAYQKNEDKDHHLHEGKQPQIFEDHGPGVQHHHLHIKDNKDQGNDVEADIELDPGRPQEPLATFVRAQLVWVIRPGPQNPRQNQGKPYKQRRKKQKYQDEAKILEHKKSLPARAGAALTHTTDLISN